MALVSSSQAAIGRRRGNGLDITKSFFTEKGVKLWNSLPGDVVELPFLETYKRCVNVALEDIV